MNKQVKEEVTFESLNAALVKLRQSGHFERVKLTGPQKEKWQETRAALLFACPMFSHIFYEMLVPDNAEAREHLAFFTDKVERAATDGYEIYINPNWFFELPLLQRIFVLVHEIMHAVWNHCGLGYMFHQTEKVITSAGKVLSYKAGLMNQAMDYVINDLLIESGIGEKCENICWDKNIGTKDDSCIDVYEKLYKQKSGGGGGWIDVLLPGTGQGKEPAQASAERSDAQWQVVVAAAAASAKAQGKLPAALEQAFGALLEPKVSWADHIRAFFARKVGSGSYDWRSADEELIVRGLGVLEGEAIFAPGRSGFGANLVVVGMDSSGSIYVDPTLIDRFMAELSGILSDVRPRRIVVMWCDAMVHRIDEAEDASDLEVIRAKGAKGGGGTSFIPVFNEIAEMRLEPDALVYLTDGDGSFPKEEPKYPVLWGNITPRYDGGGHYPFGEVVTVPTQD